MRRPSPRRVRALTVLTLAAAAATLMTLIGAWPARDLDAADARPTLPRPPADALSTALRQPCIDFARPALRAPRTPSSLPTEPRSSDVHDAGATLILAAAAEAGSPAARSAVRRSIEHLIDARARCRRDTFRTASSEPTASGGTSAQHELWATAMIAIARHDRRLWGSFNRHERRRIDLIMRGSLISNAFVMSDHNPFALGPERERTIDGITNVGRDWAPNFREGMLGQVLAGIVYFGRRGAAKELAQWDRARFVRDVRLRKMRNLETTFTWGDRHAGAGVPTDEQVRAALTNWTYRGVGLDRPMELWALVTRNTYGLPVSCGLRGGSGVPTAGPSGRATAGRLADPSRCGELAVGAQGMLREFDATDAGGPRSSLLYAYMGFRANVANQVVLLAGGLWRPGVVAINPPTHTDQLLQWRAVGVDDLARKFSLGYVSYANGALTPPPGLPAGTTVLSAAQLGAYAHGPWLTRTLLDRVATPAIDRLRREAVEREAAAAAASG